MRPSTEEVKGVMTQHCLAHWGPQWYSGAMRALGSEGSPSVRVQILSTVRVIPRKRQNNAASHSIVL
ncbi:hypothetical protein E2C01_073419 [Portunus trituberculatus]|uniref:Uncharacterized protein n=1 Tax=Portunus trituberculatus TaxID=210409 RepID=A0A5B7I5B0_PORTR|nr:hypothetical protein [Portunus trituberculatus]